MRSPRTFAFLFALLLAPTLARAAVLTVDGEQSPVTVPFQLIDNRIFVDVKLNARGPYHCIFDTGGSAAISSRVAKELGLKVQGAGSTSGVGENTVQLGTTELHSVTLGGVELRDLAVSVIPLDDTPHVFGRTSVDAIFGQPFFERYVVSIDYERKLVTFRRPSQFDYNGDGTAVDFERPSNIPVVQAELDGVRARFGVDTGARSALLLYAPFADKNHLRDKYHAMLEGITGWGIGGPVRSQIARARVLKVGGVEVRDIVIRLSSQKTGLTTSTQYDGLIGPDVLRQFTVTFDYSRKRMILERNASYGRRDSWDRLGAWFGQKGDHFVVLDVMPSSPAKSAGLKVGDEILDVNGRATDKLDLPEVRAEMRRLAPGTQVRLGVRSGQETRKVTVTLRDLV